MKLHLIKHADPNKPLEKLILENYIKRIPYSSKLDKFDITEAARNGYHIISVAFIGLTYFSYVCQDTFNIDQYEQDRLITPINTKKKQEQFFRNIT